MKKEWTDAQKQPGAPTTQHIGGEKDPFPPGPPGAAAGAATGAAGAPYGSAGEHADAAKPESSAPGTPSGAGKPGNHAGGPHGTKPGKMTPEQKAEMEKYEEQRRVEQHERVVALTKTLKDRLRPFVDANQSPTGGEGARAEVERWEKMIRTEAEDLKLESFGIELLRLIGSVYFTKGRCARYCSASVLIVLAGTTYARLHGSKSLFANFLGLPSFFASTRAKGKLIKEAWGMVSTTVRRSSM